MNRRAFLLAPLALLGACALRRGAPLPGSLQDVDELTRAIVALGGSVDIYEARKAAALAYSETHRLALAYEIVDPPLLHNARVNAGSKPRGLCWHWATDMQAGMDAAGFRTLQTHRAIANSDNPIRIDHSTTIISAKGAPWHTGIVLDPWRNGGVLFWSPVSEDTHYKWDEREAVLRRHGRIRYARQGDPG